MTGIFSGIYYRICIVLVACLVTGAYPENWQKVADVDSTDVYSITGHSGALYAATTAQIYKSMDAGDSWQPTAQQPLASSELIRLFSHENTLYLGTRGNGIFYTTDGGQSWKTMNNGLSGFATRVTGFAALGDSLYAGTEGSGVYVLNLQNPVFWSAYNTGLFQYSTNSLISNGNTLIAGIGRNLYVRPRSASQWTVVNLDTMETQRDVYDLLPAGQYLYAGTDNGIYQGSPDGKNWQRTDIQAFPGADIVALAAYQSRILAGLLYHDQHWIFSSDNDAGQWDIQAHEFAWLSDLYVSGNRLWAGRGDGLWYLDISGWTGFENPNSIIPSEFCLDQNYPNPFNPSTTITFSLPQAGHVELKIFDIQGNELQTLLSEPRAAGKHTIQFNTNALASGIYVYRLVSGQSQASRRMILLR